jgi:hypothetical protein
MEGTRPITQLPATRVLFFTEILLTVAGMPPTLLSRNFDPAACILQKACALHVISRPFDPLV